MHFQEFEGANLAISYRMFLLESDLVFRVKEPNRGLRMEVVLLGEFPVQVPGQKPLVLRAGQYHITGSSVYQCQFHEAMESRIVVLYYPVDMLDSLGTDERLGVCGPRLMPQSMNELIFSMLQNPYSSNLQQFFYDNCLRQLAFLHLATNTYELTETLKESEIAAIHLADNLIASDLGVHLSIPALARRAGTNAYTIKKGFRKLFGVGPFERLLQRRMMQAKTLLETTEKPIKEIATLAGYNTVAGFITGFRKRYQVTPEVWRMKVRGGGKP